MPFFPSELAGSIIAIPGAPPGLATSAVVRINDSAVVQTLLAANAARQDASFYNDSDQNLFLKLGAGASLVDFTVKLIPDAFYELAKTSQGVYTGEITGIWTINSTGAVQVDELSL